MIKITQLQKTCCACPAQWEGRLSDGRYIYIRYRWSDFSVGIGATDDDAVISDDRYYEDQIEGRRYSGGWMDTRDMLKVIRGVGIKVTVKIWLAAHVPKIKFTYR